jgi:hypothetical protein
MAARDELTPALTRTWNKRLAQHGFRRVGRRDLQNVSNGIIRLFYFQISQWGSRDFCVNVTAHTICGNDSPVLEPGFRLRHPYGSDMWLPSSSAEDAAKSVEIAWTAAEEQALPWFERNSTLEGHLEVLRADNRVARHHVHFQIGVVEAMLGRLDEAKSDLLEASRLYADDDGSRFSVCIAKAKSLIDAIDRGDSSTLLEQWRTANLSAHRIKQ